MTTFHTYDPSSRFNQSPPKACEACYVRKVRCDFADGSTVCRNCTASQAECRPRTRKRKAASVDHATQITDSKSNANARRRNTETGAREKHQHTDAQEGSPSSFQDDPQTSRALRPSADPSDLAAPFLFIVQCKHTGKLSRYYRRGYDVFSRRVP